MISAASGLPREGTVIRRFPVGEAIMKNALAAIGEVMSGFGLMGLSVVIPLMIEPHLGSIVRLNPETRWKFNFLAGVCFAVGLAQLFAIARTWLSARLWVAKSGVALSGVLWAVFYKVDFYGVQAFAAVLFVGNLLATLRWELREAERNRAE